jgi:integrase
VENIAMSKITEFNQSLQNYCKGRILSARIYSDVSGNKCDCSGKFSKRVPHDDHPDLLVPRCDLCNKYPALFHIDADAKDVNGNKIRIKIRHTRNSERLDRISRVIYTFERIHQEINDNTFDIRHYDSATSREKFVFKNYIQEYLTLQEARLVKGDITPKALKDKQGLIKRELLLFFGSIELSRITPGLIAKFKNKKEFIKKERTRDLALGELKAILNQAVRDEMLVTCPKFDPIARSKTRKETISIDVARKTVAVMHKELYRDMYAVLLIYPLRPCELRALEWRHIDFVRDEFTVSQHFSDEVLIQGRKSIKKGEKNDSVTYPMTAEIRAMFLKYFHQRIHRIDGPNFVFIGRFGNHISGETLADSWRNARKKLGHKFEAYECRHAATSELYDKVNGDLIRLKDVSGHNNTQTLERYVRVKTDMRGLF